jgi:hypothetical protein
MPEANGGDLRNRVSKLEAASEEIKDALYVHAVLEAKAAARIKEHAQWLVDHEDAMTRHRIRMDEIDDKLNALIDIMMKRAPGPENP